MVVDAHKVLRVLGSVHAGGCSSGLREGRTATVDFTSGGGIAFATGQLRKDVGSLEFHLRNARPFWAFPAPKDAGFGIHFMIAVLPSGAGIADVTAIDVLGSHGERLGDLACRGGFCD
jgi:hypothetical protein